MADGFPVGWQRPAKAQQGATREHEGQIVVASHTMVKELLLRLRIALRDRLAADLGQPKMVLVAGTGMGGLIATLIAAAALAGVITAIGHAWGNGRN